MKRRLILITLTAVTALLMAGPAWADLITVSQSGPTSWDLFIQPLPATGVGGWDIDFAYNPAVIDPAGVILGTFLGSVNPADFETLYWADTSVPGLWTVMELSLLPGNVLLGSEPPSGIFLATLLFNPVGPGDPSVSLARADVADVYGDPLSGAAIPEPATCVLIGSGLALLARYRKTRRG